MTYGNPWDYNKTEAFKSLNNLTQNLASNLTDADIINNTNVTAMTNVSLTNDSQTFQAFVYPADKLWVQTIFGSWFYVIMIYAITLLVFTKHDGDITVAAWVLLLLSALSLGAVEVGNILMPVEIIRILYVSVALGLIGVFFTIAAGQ